MVSLLILGNLRVRNRSGLRFISKFVTNRQLVWKLTMKQTHTLRYKPKYFPQGWRAFLKSSVQIVSKYNRTRITEFRKMFAFFNDFANSVRCVSILHMLIKRYDLFQFINALKLWISFFIWQETLDGWLAVARLLPTEDSTKQKDEDKLQCFERDTNPRF